MRPARHYVKNGGESMLLLSPPHDEPPLADARYFFTYFLSALCPTSAP